jgi:putative sigma-54 modulation protein
LIISTSSHNVLMTSDLDDFVVRTLYAGLDRLSDKVLSVDVFMKDINGPKGGVDKQVVVRMHLRNGRQLVVEAVADNLRSAVRQSTRRAKRAVNRSLRKSRRIEKLRVATRLGDRSVPSEATA